MPACFLLHRIAPHRAGCELLPPPSLTPENHAERTRYHALRVTAPLERSSQSEILASRLM
ncbi:hypothetical protein PG991_007817 [Apiospora marii]|uniref:Uncharacterized protein n=1 Tax=Apiospora marii TaxID=335849 RepID=A0ABR1RUQ9_9PEZI